MKALEIAGLQKKYGENEVLKSINLSIEEGGFFALLGHNGAGKTTAIGIITDLVEKTAGTVKVFGEDIDVNFPKAKTYIGVVPQEFNFNMWTKVEDIPVIQAGFYGIPKKIAKERTEKLLKKLELWDHRNKQSMDLSGGMKRRLMIARALVHEPKLLILDEPTAGVDVELRKTMWEFIKEINEEGTTILLTTHYLEEVEALCKNVAIISKGNIVHESTTKELLASLDEEVFVLDLIEGKADVGANLSVHPKTGQTHRSAPTLHPDLEPFKSQIIKETQLEVTISKKHTLNELFTILNKNNIQIGSMRNKVNRVEQLFMNLTK